MLQHDSFPFHAHFLPIAHKRAHTSESGKCALFLFVWIPVKSFADKGVYFAIGVVVVICLILFLGWLMQRGESRAS